MLASMSFNWIPYANTNKVMMARKRGRTLAESTRFPPTIERHADVMADCSETPMVK